MNQHCSSACNVALWLNSPSIYWFQSTLFPSKWRIIAMVANQFTQFIFFRQPVRITRFRVNVLFNAVQPSHRFDCCQLAAPKSQPQTSVENRVGLKQWFRCPMMSHDVPWCHMMPHDVQWCPMSQLESTAGLWTDRRTRRNSLCLRGASADTSLESLVWFVTTLGCWKLDVASQNTF